jgi:hypothetical protein
MASQLFDDYYALLGVPANADGEQLRKAWRQLVLRWHPDRAGDGATATFQQLSAAYAVLSDPITRIAYDRRRRASGDPTPPPPQGGARNGGEQRAERSEARASAPRAAAAASPPARPARRTAPAVMLSRLSGSLTSLLACGAARLDEPDLITLVLRADEAAQGGMATISMRVELWCPDCAAPERSAGCARCGGRRTVDELFSAWLAVPPGATAGEVLAPSVDLPGMIEPVRFRVRLSGAP